MSSFVRLFSSRQDLTEPAAAAASSAEPVRDISDNITNDGDPDNISFVSTNLTEDESLVSDFASLDGLPRQPTRQYIPALPLCTCLEEEDEVSDDQKVATDPKTGDTVNRFYIRKCELKLDGKQLNSLEDEMDATNVARSFYQTNRLNY